MLRVIKMTLILIFCVSCFGGGSKASAPAAATTNTNKENTFTTTVSGDSTMESAVLDDTVLD